MGLNGFGADPRRASSLFTLVAATLACACGSAQDTPAATHASTTGHKTTAEAGSPASATADNPASGDDATPGPSPDDTDAAPAESDADAPDAMETEAAPPCVKGQVTPNEVVMLGDSYLDPAWGNVGPTLMMKAGGVKYRPYYIGGASMAWGNPNTQFYIPYQFDPMALTDPAVMNPSDIKVVIMDGGGNDVLIGNNSCETTAPPSNTSCVTSVQNAIDVAQSKMMEMAQKGVKQVVFFFYPHLDTAGGGILATPAPAVNDTLDYAYPLAEKICCGSTFTSSMTQYSCAGQPAAGMTCVFVDTRPAFEGHLSDYIKSDKVHPTQAGADVIAGLLWDQMQAHCIAQ
jgi:hypothetical protein